MGQKQGRMQQGFYGAAQTYIALNRVCTCVLCTVHLNSGSWLRTNTYRIHPYYLKIIFWCYHSSSAIFEKVAVKMLLIMTHF